MERLGSLFAEEEKITTLTTRIAGRTKSLSLGRYRYVALVLLLGVVLTAVVFNTEQKDQQAHTQAEFERQAQTYVAAIQRGIGRNLEVIESIGGLFAASDKVERDDFRIFLQGPLSRNQEIHALSWNKRVAHSERRQFEDEFQSIRDWLLDGQRVLPIERPEYIVVTYIEPESNQSVQGLDIASNPTRLAALERARDTGEMIATARITLVQETGQQYGFLILKPIYKSPTAPKSVEGRRQDLKGFAVGVFRIGDMVEAALENLPKGIINIQLTDEASPADEGLLYLGPAADRDNPADVVNPQEVGEGQLKARGELLLREPLEIPGRQWSLLITPTSEFLRNQASLEPRGVLAAGLLITALVVAYLITVINHGAKTQRLAAELTTVNEGLETEVTQRKRAEEEIKASLKEKEVLLREIHHRVKNNLQIISSLLNLQSSFIKDKKALEIFGESRNRVRSLALIHEKLYRSHDLARIDFGDYLRSLTVNLLGSYGVDTNVTTVKINADDVLLDIDTAIPCALIINELVSNSLKHAFPAGKEGEIGIDFRVDNDNEYVLTVRDNGVGLPRDFDLQNTESFGLKLVSSLASDQLGGTIEFHSSSDGAEFEVEFAALQPA